MLAASTGMALLCHVIFLLIFCAHPGYTSEFAYNQQSAHPGNAHGGPSGGPRDVNKRYYGGRSFAQDSGSRADSGESEEGSDDFPEPPRKMTRVLFGDKERDKRPFGPGSHYESDPTLYKRPFGPGPHNQVLEEDTPLEEDKRQFMLGKREPKGMPSQSEEREVEKRPFGNGVHHWEPKTRSQEEKEAAEKGGKQRTKVMPQKRPFGPLMQDTVRLPGPESQLDDDDVDKRKLFSFGKRKQFSFGKRKKFAFGKRKKFAFGKRPKFSFGKRRHFSFGKRQPE